MKSTITIVLLTLFLCVNNSFATKEKDKLIPVSKDNKWGYCNTSKDLVINYLFDGVEPFNDSGLAIVTVKQKKGVIDLNGEWVIKPKYSEIRQTLKDQEYIVYNTKNKAGIISGREEKLLPIKYDSIRVFDQFDTYLVYQNNSCGLYSVKERKWKIDPVYKSLVFDINNFLLIENEQGVGILDPISYSMITEPKVSHSKSRGIATTELITFDKWDDIAAIKTVNGYNLINKKGELLTQPSESQIREIDTEYYQSQGFDIADNALYISKNIIYSLEEDGTIVTTELEDHKINPHPSFEIKKVTAGSYVLFNDDEEIPLKYDSLVYFNHRVLQGISFDSETGETKHTLISLDEESLGEILVNDYESLRSYSPVLEGDKPVEWIIVMDDQNKQGVYDIDLHEFVVDIKYDQLYTPYVEEYGLLIVGNRGEKYAFYDINKQSLVTDMRYESTVGLEIELTHKILLLERKVKDGPARQVTDLYSLKDKKLTGTSINGHAISMRHQKGTVHYSNNRKGWEQNIDYQFSEFAPEHYAFMFLQDKGEGKIGIGFLDKDFNTVFPSKYATVEFVEEGNPYLKVTDFEFNEGIVKTDGSVVVPLGKYVSVGAMKDGMAPVVDQNGRSFYINEKGEEYSVND
ncbi:WG repeat-containing protein [Flammeovirga kamogawensis]|uniref:WG repeat-containing protein n=1 Tax=Flammeovirga kamogawensis TaxID=373891 RepID=A0ABX8GV24_9BACT|nr:WG repeat-containing protein [Flammeovirga kamogawensis]MBB6459870.1 hypothetical protein [Flammeovirga kamogawensis]QWG07077.1 WG repeat-containing protein [Flammeovirga kamogawensis]TRX68898.1 WG repeat-containing protein [Flammeovirga kamogawensis]